jgi:hypothetical protein
MRIRQARTDLLNVRMTFDQPKKKSASHLQIGENRELSAIDQKSPSPTRFEPSSRMRRFLIRHQIDVENE